MSLEGAAGVGWPGSSCSGEHTASLSSAGRKADAAAPPLNGLIRRIVRAVCAPTLLKNHQRGLTPSHDPLNGVYEEGRANTVNTHVSLPRFNIVYSGRGGVWMAFRAFRSHFFFVPSKTCVKQQTTSGMGSYVRL